DRQQALREATEFGMIGALPVASAAAVPPPAPVDELKPVPTTPLSAVADDVSARGNMWGDEVGDAFGAGGLGLSGVGEGGGGKGEGIGSVRPRAAGGLSGISTGQGFGAGHGRLGGS